MPLISHLSYIPRRIVSLVPSQTELLFYLGLESQIAGITKFCVHPKELCKQKPKIGGTKNFRFEVIDQLAPDLIIGNKEENYRDGIERLAEKYPVWISDIYTLADALQMITRVGELSGKKAGAESLVFSISEKFGYLPKTSGERVAYLIWQKPYMVAASGTFINDMLMRCGFENMFAAQTRYPEISEAQLADSHPDYIFLSSEPFPFRDKHIARFQQICPTASVVLVDGEMFSWYGSRLLLAADYLINLVEILQKGKEKQPPSGK